MSDYLAYLTAQREVRDLTTSALPDAPTLPHPAVPATGPSAAAPPGCWSALHGGWNPTPPLTRRERRRRHRRGGRPWTRTRPATAATATWSLRPPSC
jgi:hypothetical protein